MKFESFPAETAKIVVKCSCCGSKIPLSDDCVGWMGKKKMKYICQHCITTINKVMEEGA